MSAEPLISKCPSVCIVTGASRGLGRAFTLALAKILHKDSIFVLMARSVNLLQEVKNELIKDVSKSPSHVIIVEFDQKKVVGKEFVENLFTQILQPQLSSAMGTADYDTCLILHNAGTLGDPKKKAVELTDVEEIKNYFNINLNGLIVFNAMCLRELFANTKNRFLVNISSLAGIQAFKCLSSYCTGKAARDMFFKVLAIEEPSIRVLNYAPGPVDTDMQTYLRENISDAESKEKMKELVEQGNLLKAEDSAQKLVEILCRNTFTSGDHVDYFD